MILWNILCGIKSIALYIIPTKTQRANRINYKLQIIFYIYIYIIFKPNIYKCTTAIQQTRFCILSQIARRVYHLH
jgi:hypothetical protein